MLRDEVKQILLARDAQEANIAFPEKWIDLIYQLDKDIAELDQDYKVIQVKAKWGEFCFYYSPSRDDETLRAKINELIYDATNKAREL